MTAFFAVLVASLGLRWLNIRHQKREGHHVPVELADVVDAERLRRIADYTRARWRLGLVSSIVRNLLFAAFLFAGLLGSYDRALSGLTDSFVLSGVLFFAGLSVAGALIEVPFGLYDSFRIEARYGFNRSTPRLWWGDWAKSTALALLLTAVVSAGAFSIVRAAPQTWWLFVWVLLVGLSVLMTFLSPYLIEPLFYEMKPLRVDGLEQEVRALAEKAGVHLSRVLEVDASRRSSHSNAYFTGIGPVKRVVLFDTLLGHMTHSEILAVLAHELGHWKKHHVLVRMLVMCAFGLAMLYLAFQLLPSPRLPELIGLEAASFPARLSVLGSLASLALFPVTPLFSYWSRRHEWQADEFAVALYGRPNDLANALMKLASENLSNLHPHPLYAAFYYSHPPMPERIRKLRSIQASSHAA